jgi:hypothetical protein
MYCAAVATVYILRFTPRAAGDHPPSPPRRLPAVFSVRGVA